MQFYSTATLALKCSVCRKTVWGWIVHGLPIAGVQHKLKAERWGRQYRISEDDWLAFHAAINGQSAPTDTARDRQVEAGRERLRAYGVI